MGINNQGGGNKGNLNKPTNTINKDTQNPNRQPGQQSGFGQGQGQKQPQGGHQQPGSADKTKAWGPKKDKDDQR